MHNMKRCLGIKFACTADGFHFFYLFKKKKKTLLSDVIYTRMINAVLLNENHCKKV